MKLKISTLFHWLYATLMFLPILMFLPSCFYYGFNEHATNTETTTINYKYESNEVNSLSDLVEGNIYQFNFVHSSSLTFDFDFYLIDGYIEGVIDTSEVDENFYYNVPSIIEFTHSSYSVVDFYNVSENIPFSFTFQSLNINAIIQLKNIYVNDDLPFTSFTYTDYNVIDSVSVNTDDTITDKVAYAWERTWNLPLFAWTQNSFVAAPFSYITGLFGLSSDNSINYVFTYFVSISICWLVFDLIMYVPNLAHRWLDRSAIE